MKMPSCAWLCRQRGFTLIELAIVLLLLGLFISVVAHAWTWIAHAVH